MRRILLAATAAASLLAPASPAWAGDMPYIGEIMLTAGSYCPAKWFEANGQLLPIVGYTSLFSIVGAAYGGDGRNTFALPDLRGRVPIHVGAGPGLPPVKLGQRIGAPSMTLTVDQMPRHSHRLLATHDNNEFPSPVNNSFPTFDNQQKEYSDGTPDTVMNAATIVDAGRSQPFDRHQPSLGLRYCIAFEGLFPPP